MWRQRQATFRHNAFQRIRPRRKIEIGILGIEWIAFRLRERHELKSLGSIHAKQPGQHLRIEGSNVHQQHIRNIAAVQRLRETSVISDAVLCGSEITLLE